jgi:hypothetical protein
MPASAIGKFATTAVMTHQCEQPIADTATQFQSTRRASAYFEDVEGEAEIRGWR